MTEADGVGWTSVWVKLLGVERTVVESVEYDEVEGALVVSVRPNWQERGRCGRCRRRSPGYDAGEGRRKWRALDLGTVQVFVEAEAPRVECKEHGVVVASVPWARHGARFTQYFEDTVAWLATECSKWAVSVLMRVQWKSVGRMIARVVEERSELEDRLAGVRRIGIDEVSYRKRHKYLTVVIDHDSGRLLWAAAGHDAKTLNGFFDLLGEERCAAIELVSADAATWIRNAVRDRCPNAKLCLDPFHVVSWASDALDKVRRAVWNVARKSGDKAEAKEIKGVRFVLWKGNEKLSERQEEKLSAIATLNAPLYRAYLLKEQLRQVFRTGGRAGVRLLDRWLAWACRSRLDAFVKLSRSIRKRRKAIVAALRHGLSNGRVESMNTRIRLIIRRGFGFHSAAAVIALAMLCLGGMCPPLPGRGMAL